jgi:hypothetical protein
MTNNHAHSFARNFQSAMNIAYTYNIYPIPSSISTIINNIYIPVKVGRCSNSGLFIRGAAGFKRAAAAAADKSRLPAPAASARTAGSTLSIQLVGALVVPLAGVLEADVEVAGEAATLLAKLRGFVFAADKFPPNNPESMASEFEGDKVGPPGRLDPNKEACC